MALKERGVAVGSDNVQELDGYQTLPLKFWRTGKTNRYLYLGTSHLVHLHEQVHQSHCQI